MAPQSRLSIEDAVRILTESKEFFLNNQLPAFNSKVWDEMSRKSKNVWSKKTWYLNVTQNRRQILALALGIPLIGLQKANKLTKSDGKKGKTPEQLKTPFELLEEMVYQEPYKNIIKTINLVPFFIILNSKSQFNAYKRYCQVSAHSKLSIDVTDNLVEVFTPLFEGDAINIIVYTITINVNGLNMCINHMLSAQHKESIVEHWLRQWKHERVPVPIEIVTPYSTEILCASCLVFNNCKLETYIDKCFLWTLKHRKGKNELRCVQTFIRVSASNVISLVQSWDCINGDLQPEIYLFYIQCVALLINSSNIEEFRKVYFLICVSALQPHADSQIPTFAQTAQNAIDILKCLICSQQEIINDLLALGCSIVKSKVLAEIYFGENEDNQSFTETEKWVHSIRIIAETSTIGSEMNSFYMPQFIGYLEKLAGQFPLWTNATIINNEQCASTFYKDDYLKNVLEDPTKKISIHDFIDLNLNNIKEENHKVMEELNNLIVLRHKTSRYTDAYCPTDFHKLFKKKNESIIKENYSSSICKFSETDFQINYSFNVQNEEEINSNKETPKIQIRSLINKNSTNDIHSKNFDALQLHFLRNGLHLPPSKIENQNIWVVNTCGFDAIAHILCVAALDIESYKTNINQSEHKMLQFVSNFLKDGSNNKILIERTKILRPLYTCEASKRCIRINVEDSIFGIWNKLFSDEPSVTKYFHCANINCHTKVTTMASISVNFNTILSNGFAYLQDSIIFKETDNIKCTNCKKLGVEEMIASNQVLIELDVRNQQNPISGQMCLLDTFPTFIKLSNNYRLIGAVGYDNHYSTGHFIAYCQRSDGLWQEFDDLDNSAKTISANKKILPHAVIYVRDI